jgi:hypothetical protein
MASSSLTATTLLAEASTLLGQNGYQRVEPSMDLRSPLPTRRLFEDLYSIVALLVYETWGELRDTWTNAQGSLTELISANVRRGEAKAWEGYLVVLTPASAATEVSQVDRIRYDVTRVRKLVATAEDLLELGDVRRILLPLLPLESGLSVGVSRSAIDLIPDLLAVKGTPEEFGRAVVEAFRQQEPLVEALHRARTSE